MDAAVESMKNLYPTTESLDNNLSFTELLSLVAHEAESRKGWLVFSTIL
jgi:hypothetical protein